MDQETKPSFAQWRVIALLVLSVAINYIDRGSLSIAAPPLSKELSLAPDQMGLLFSAFFWSYAGFMIVAGWLADRFQVSLVLTIGYLVWSLATLGTGWVNSLYGLLAMRLLLGLGESVSYPAYSKIIAEGFPISQRGLPNAMIDAGAKVGPAIGTLIGGLLVAHYGWRFLFFALGLGSMVWLLPWFIWAPRGRSHVDSGRDEGPSLLEICRRQDAWGTFIGNFCCNYAYYFILTWLPSYLVTERGLNISTMAVLGSLPFWAGAISSLAGGWASDRWIARGGTPTRVRKTFVVTGITLSTLMFPAAIVRDLRVSIGLLVASYVAYGIFSSNHWAITQTLAGPRAAGKWTGLQNGISNLAGVIAPFVTGLIVSKTGNFYLAFSSASAILLVGALCYLFVVGEVSPIAWGGGRTAARQETEHAS